MTSSARVRAESRRLAVAIVITLAMPFFLGSLAGGASAADAPPAITVLSDPQSKEPISPPLTLTVHSGATDAEELVFLKQSSGKELTGVKLLVRGLGIDFTQGVAPDGTVTLPDAQPIAVGIKATNPSPDGTGTVFAEIPQQGTVKLIDLAIRRSRADVIHLAGVGSDGKLALASDTTDFNRDVRITSSSPQQESVSVSVDPLTDPAGASVPLAVQLGGTALTGTREVTVPGFGRVPLTLSATLTASGMYTTTISLVHDQTAVDVPVTITRSHDAPTIALGTVTSSQGLAHWFKAGATVIVPFDETSGRPLSLSAPAIELEKSTGDGQRSYSGFTATIDEQRGETIPVAADLPSHLSIQLGGLSPGTYTAHVRFHGGPTPLQATATVFVRRSILWAIVLIALGIVLAEIVRRLRGASTQRLQRRLIVSSLEEQLERITHDGGATLLEQPQIQALNESIANLATDIDAKPSQDPQPIIDEIRNRLGVLARWLPMRRAVRTGTAGPGVTTQLATAAQYLDGDSGTSLEAANAALDAAATELAKAMTPDSEVRDVSKPCTISGGASAAASHASAIPSVPGPSIPPVKDVSRELSRLQLIVALLVAPAAILLGVYLLWVPDPAWGTADDLIVAFLWGLGLHTVGNQAFGGLATLGTTISGGS